MNRRRIRVIPVILPGTQSNFKMPDSLNAYKSIDFRFQMGDHAYDQLAQGIEAAGLVDLTNPGSNADAPAQLVDLSGNSMRRVLANARSRGSDEPRRTETVAKGVPINVFISYSHSNADRELREELGKHLLILEREGIIHTWHDRKINAGDEFKRAIDDHLLSARLILLLISPDFINSTYCWEKEMPRAMKRHESRDARVVPVILRTVSWDTAPFAGLNALPTEGGPVTSWVDRDKALNNVAMGIRALVEAMLLESN